jgi:hypothetical protein
LNLRSPLQGPIHWAPSSSQNLQRSLPCRVK